MLSAVRPPALLADHPRASRCVRSLALSPRSGPNASTLKHIKVYCKVGGGAINKAFGDLPGTKERHISTSPVACVSRFKEHQNLEFGKTCEDLTGLDPFGKQLGGPGCF